MLARDSKRPRPFLVELVGPAGAGKSTIFEALLKRDRIMEPMPILRHRPYTAVLLWNLLRVPVMLARHQALLRRWSWRQLVTIAYLRALPRVLRARDRADERIVLFDQGPIFFLTRPSLSDERLRPWWHRTFDTWSTLLDAVIWLEAPDAVLLERINARRKLHRVKGLRDDEAFEFLAESRAVYEDAVGRLEAVSPGPAILRFDTSLRSADEIVEDVLATLTRLRLLAPAA